MVRLRWQGDANISDPQRGKLRKEKREWNLVGHVLCCGYQIKLKKNVFQRLAENTIKTNKQAKITVLQSWKSLGSKTLSLKTFRNILSNYFYYLFPYDIKTNKTMQIN